MGASKSHFGLRQMGLAEMVVLEGMEHRQHHFPLEQAGGLEMLVRE